MSSTNIDAFPQYHDSVEDLYVTVKNNVPMEGVENLARNGTYVRRTLVDAIKGQNHIGRKIKEDSILTT
ncbi:hypothetical protein MRB53_000818 [Persea americana]|uniref:Uncharacterized protein n=1 Tax=Persea americana TaxID=3435 RepID=A0ACC2MQV8_PERAE|nr:hypothetical protein MRB53_000818 [Persea americana]